MFLIFFFSFVILFNVDYLKWIVFCFIFIFNVLMNGVIIFGIKFLYCLFFLMELYVCSIELKFYFVILLINNLINSF